MRRSALLAICLAADVLLVPAAFAVSAPSRIHGVIEEFDGQYLSIKADSGTRIVIGVQPTTRIVHNHAMKLAELEAGDFVGTLALLGLDGKLRAQAVRVFPTPNLGTGEGQYALESYPSRIVTNGRVALVTIAPSGATLAVTFHGATSDANSGCSGRAPSGDWGCTGSVDLFIARGVPITALSDGDTTLFLPGAIVSASATSDAASLLTASSITVERDAKLAQ